MRPELRETTMEHRLRLRRPGGILLSLSLVAGIGVVGLVSSASPADAAVTINSTAINGTVGVTQTVSATVASTTSGVPSGTVTFTANSQAIGTATVGGSSGAKAQVSWTPTTAASTIVQASFAASTGETASDSDTVTIAKVDTASSITTPGSAAASTKIPLIATVQSKSGQYVPTGNVTFSLSNGTVIGTDGLDGSGKATVTYTTPTTTGTVSVLATYVGDGNANGSKSETDSIKVTANASTVSLTVPQTNYVNTSVPLVAKVSPSSAPGTVEFALNGKSLGTTTVKSGTATLTWVPNAIGTFTLTAKYSGGGGVNSGTATNKVTVVAQLKSDQITVDPAGDAGPWVPSTVVTLTNGAEVTLAATSASGQAVKLSVVGPCTLNGNVLHVNGVGGACALTASTAGGNGYAAASQKYTVQTGTGAQTAKIVAPPTGYYARGRMLRLSRLDAVTNINQAIRWRVTPASKTKCRIVASGLYYKVKLVKHGLCRVRGSSPAISNQWTALLVKRTYGIK